MKYKKYVDLDYYYSHSTSIPLTLYPHKLDPLVKYEGDVVDYHIQYGESPFGKLIFSTLHKESDYNLLLSYAVKHGRFLEKFFFRDLSYRFRKELLENTISIEEIKIIYAKHFQKELSDIVYKHYISDLIFSFVKVSIYFLMDFKIYDEILAWEKNYSSERECVICGKKFNVTKHPDWAYYGSNGNTSICFECPVPIEINKNEVNQLISKLVRLCGFIPESNFSLLNNNFTSRINKDNWAQIADTVMKMGVSSYYNDTIKDLYGSWFKALVEARILEEGVLKTARGIKCIAKSGNECNSLDEMFIDNWLFERGYQMVKEPRYPVHEKYNPKGLRRADWLVNNYYIEYFGLAGDEKYDQKTYEKIELLKELDLKYIAIFREDLKYLDAKFSDLAVSQVP